MKSGIGERRRRADVLRLGGRLLVSESDSALQLKTQILGVFEPDHHESLPTTPLDDRLRVGRDLEDDRPDHLIEASSSAFCFASAAASSMVAVLTIGGGGGSAGLFGTPETSWRPVSMTYALAPHTRALNA